MNDLMSGGLHRLWKDDVIAWMAPPKRPRRSGFSTWPAARAISRALPARGGPGSATLFDINPEMVDVGASGSSDAGLSGRVTFRRQRRSAPFPDKTFDAYTSDSASATSPISTRR